MTAVKMDVLAWTLLLFVPSLVLATEKIVYFKLDGELKLTPPPASIKYLTWKLNQNLVVEFSKAEGRTFYGTFKDRSELDTVSGVLTIKLATPADAGLYTVEINNQDVTDVAFRGELIDEVRVPTIETQPLVCDKTCTLKCVSNTSGSGPVSYQWHVSDKDWIDGSETLEICNNETTNNVQYFRCRLTNPVSQSESELFENPFYEPPIPPLAIAAGVILPLAVIVGGVLLYKYQDKWKRYVRANDGSTPDP